MNALRISTRSLPIKSFTRGFHVNRPCFTGKTIEATSDNFKQLVNDADHPVIVDFYADWCGPCKMLTPLLTKFVEKNPAVTLVKINVDDHNDIAAKYKIASLPTVIAFNKGEEVDKFIGLLSGPKVESFVQAHAGRK
ncbi:thioredoxin-like protein [Cunninghamella echinulata]|nr:thioredoxin-like protein [Cunninghamella echinulata]